MDQRLSSGVSPAGYLHGSYAESLSEFGQPFKLVGSEGWILLRTIPRAESVRDAMGCYPLFCCRDWSKLNSDLDQLEGQIVSIAIVADPFGEYDTERLRECFPDAFTHFKDHFVVDLGREPKDFIHPHHRRNARKAFSQLSVEVCRNQSHFIEDWISLYEELTRRHRIIGVAAFSKDSFVKQFLVPGIVVFRAASRNRTEGMLLWYVQDGVAYYHLGAYSEVGYKLGASFALFQAAIEEFQHRGLRWLNLGAGAGVDATGDLGLTRFKAGWSTGVRPAFFCGRILHLQKYWELGRLRDIRETNYFPAYRLGEFS
ncbi:MAG TPA: GNAT family N-acetyltransferase [Pyrinomonadaceae bacterium]|nr:GNAT family N-acetyltransferase [Pyrinomonadaceae bacterium]